MQGPVVRLIDELGTLGWAQGHRHRQYQGSAQGDGVALGVRRYQATAAQGVDFVGSVLRGRAVAGVLSPDEIRTSLYARHPQLNGERAIDLINQGLTIGVLAVLDRLDDEV